MDFLAKVKFISASAASQLGYAAFFKITVKASSNLNPNTLACLQKEESS